LGTTLTDACIHREIKNRLNLGNAFFHSVQSLLFPCLLSRNVKIKIIILLAVLYGCETWSLTLREGSRLRVFENRVRRTRFGPKRGEVMGEWRKLHSGEFCNLYLSQNIIRKFKSRRTRWVGHAALMGEERKVYKTSVGKPKGKRLFRRLRHRWEDGIRMGLCEFCWVGVEWIHLAQDRDWWQVVVNMVMNLRILAPQS
jgi:predicted small integral membrane protein